MGGTVPLKGRRVKLSELRGVAGLAGCVVCTGLALPVAVQVWLRSVERVSHVVLLAGGVLYFSA